MYIYIYIFIYSKTFSLVFKNESVNKKNKVKPQFLIYLILRYPLNHRNMDQVFGGSECSFCHYDNISR